MNNRQSAEGVHLLDLFYHSGIIIVIPLGQSDSLLHLLQCVFQHLGELGRHFLNPLSQLCNLILLVLQLLVLLLLCKCYCFIIFFFIYCLILSSSSRSCSFLFNISNSSLYYFCICLYWCVIADLHSIQCTQWWTSSPALLSNPVIDTVPSPLFRSH
jgi:hypothetical protein